MPAKTVSPIGPDVEDDLREMRAANPKFAKIYAERATARQLASALVGYRMENDLSQKELAKRLGMTSSEVSRLENGSHSPSVRTMDRILNKLGKRVQIVDLIRADGVDAQASRPLQAKARRKTVAGAGRP